MVMPLKKAILISCFNWYDDRLRPIKLCSSAPPINYYIMQLFGGVNGYKTLYLGSGGYDGNCYFNKRVFL